MDSGKVLSKRAHYLANEVLGVNQYQFASPSELLSRALSVNKGNMEFNTEQRERFVNLMPKKMTAIINDSKGQANYGEVVTADYVVGKGPTGSSIAGSGLVSILAMDTIMEGSQPYLATRQACQVFRMDSPLEQMPFFTAKKYVNTRAPNGDAEDLAQNMGKAMMTVKDYALTCSIGKELLADSSPDVKASILREMGASMEMTLDRVVISSMLANAYATDVSVISTKALYGFNKARGQVGANGFHPTSALISPMFQAEMISNYIPSYNEMAQKYIESGQIPQFVGVGIGESGIVPTGSTPWDWTTTNDIGCMVFDKERAGAIGIREEVVFEEFDNITKVIINPLIRARFCYTPAVDADKTGRNNKNATVRVIQAAA